jgi:hypothetical protein
MSAKLIQSLLKVGRVATMLALAASGAGCGASVSPGSDAGVNVSSQNLSYDDNENGCDTGQHSFSSQDDYCNGLENEQLNKSCAQDLRRGDFQKNCPGRTWSPS